MNEIPLFLVPKAGNLFFPDLDLSEVLVVIAYPAWPLMTWACFPLAMIALLLPTTLLSVLEPQSCELGAITSYQCSLGLPAKVIYVICSLSFSYPHLLLLFITLH